MKIVCVIPARYGSTRFPGKALAELGGKPLIQWVYERAVEAKRIDEVYVATDDERIAKAVRGFGGTAIMTSRECKTGSDRIAEALRQIAGEIVVNVQGDEPLIEPTSIDRSIQGLIESPECMVSTTAVAIRDIKEFESPNVVKVVFDREGVALYFSRSPIPSPARRELKPGSTEVLGYKHLGLYVYRRSALERFAQMPPGRLEEIEKLEQLRFLESGMKIKVVVTEFDSPGIDTPEELEALRRKLFAQ